jgi:hypothetical protein
VAFALLEIGKVTMQHTGNAAPTIVAINIGVNPFWPRYRSTMIVGNKL